jgi:hypothetical protein
VCYLTFTNCGVALGETAAPFRMHIGVTRTCVRSGPINGHFTKLTTNI